MNSYKNLKEEAWDANQALWKHGLVLLTFGNVSTIDRKRGAFAIKPSGVPYTELQPEDMVVVDLESRVVEGKLRPSSDTKTHAVLYRNFPNIGGVAHTHSTHATAWAQAVRSIPILGTTHADYLGADIPCTDVMSDRAVRGDYEEETGLQIVRTFENRSYEEIEMVLVACHGPFTWGRTAEEAVRNSVVLEELAKMAFLTLQINPKTPPLKRTLVDKHYQRKHGRDAYYGQE
ncbi:MAG: L-ribulose-5-phosphate 4-epimerase [bacterium]